MPRYVVERNFEVGQPEMPTVATRSRRVIEEEFPEITWEHSHVAVDDDGGVKTFCIYEAPNEETVLAHSRKVGAHEIKGIYEIVGDVTPEDFPL